MTTDTVISNETVPQDEVNPIATTGETASASAPSETPAPETEASSEIVETNVKSEGIASNGLNANGSTTNTESTDNSQKDQQETLDKHQEDSKSPTLNKNDLEPEAFRKVFIGGLCYKTDDQVFRDYFSKYGKILDCIIMRDRESRSRGFGFVTYSSRQMVDNLMKSRPHNLDGREIEPKRAVPREDSGKPESSLTAKKLFVGGIREDTVNEQDLHDYFSKYGNILDTIIMKSQDGKCRGFGFVEFDDYDPVDVIVLEKHHTINNNAVNVEKALPKEQTNRARMNQQNYNNQNSSMRAPPGRSMGSAWTPMHNEPPYNVPPQSGNGYPHNNGHNNYGHGDYGNRSGAYNGGYNHDMGNNNGPRNHNSNMGVYGSGSGPMNGGGYNGGGSGGSARGNYSESYDQYGNPSSGPNFGQAYGSSMGGGPMRRGMLPGRSFGAPYGRGRGGGPPSFRGQN